MADHKTYVASEIVFWVSYGFLLEGIHLTKFLCFQDKMHRVRVSV